LKSFLKRYMVIWANIWYCSGVFKFAFVWCYCLFNAVVLGVATVLIFDNTPSYFDSLCQHSNAFTVYYYTQIMLSNILVYECLCMCVCVFLHLHVYARFCIKIIDIRRWRQIWFNDVSVILPNATYGWWRWAIGKTHM
jgi:hypothetical protein